MENKVFNIRELTTFKTDKINEKTEEDRGRELFDEMAIIFANLMETYHIGRCAEDGFMKEDEDGFIVGTNLTMSLVEIEIERGLLDIGDLIRRAIFVYVNKDDMAL